MNHRPQGLGASKAIFGFLQYKGTKILTGSGIPKDFSGGYYFELTVITNSVGFQSTAWGFSKSGPGKELSAKSAGDYLITRHVMIAQ